MKQPPDWQSTPLGEMWVNYAEFALQNLSKSVPDRGDKIEFGTFVLELKVRFLFPNLEAKETLLLLGLAMTHREVQHGVAALHRHHGKGDKAQLSRLESLVSRSEARFSQARERVRTSGIMEEKLTVFQKRIVEQEWLKVQFGD